MRLVVLLAAVVAIVVLVFRAYTTGDVAPGGPAGGPSMLAGAPAQSFQLPRLGGGTGSLADYRGRIVVLTLWATWCPPCRAEMPDLERVHRALAARGVVILGIDQGESAQAAGAFVRELGVTFPILLDEQQQYGRVYEAVGLPTTIVVDRTGHIVRGIDGPVTFTQVRDIVAQLLAAR
ncbi:MAG: TlpA disulfide reductase family protein [Candidatus Baltobacteraceae bacterium]